MYNIIDIAKYLLSKDCFMTDLKLQKLVYYAYCWFIINNNYNPDSIDNRICKDHPQAWVHGPVFYELYKEMAYNRERFNSNNNYILLDPEITKFLDDILDVYGKYTGNQLENMTHNETPWIEARKDIPPNVPCSKDISDKEIFNYFRF